MGEPTVAVRVVRAGTGYRVWHGTTVIGHVVRADTSWTAATMHPIPHLTCHGLTKRSRAVSWLVDRHLEHRS